MHNKVVKGAGIGAWDTGLAILAYQANFQAALQSKAHLALADPGFLGQGPHVVAGVQLIVIVPRHAFLGKITLSVFPRPVPPVIGKRFAPLPA